MREEQADQLIKVLAGLVEEVRTLREELNGSNANSGIGQLMGSGRRKASLSDVVDAIAGIENALAERKSVQDSKDAATVVRANA